MNRLVLACALSCLTILAGCQQGNPVYASSCSARIKGWHGPSDGIGHLRPVLPVFIDASGSTNWEEIHISGPVPSNTAIISDKALKRNMVLVSELNPQPQLVLEIAPNAPCPRVQIIRNVIDNSPLCQKSKLCSEGANWKDWPLSGGF